MNKLFASIAVVTAVAAGVPSVANAQFGLPSIPGLGKSSSGAASADLGGQQDVLVRSYVAANKDVLTANSKMAEALGLKDLAVASKATADALTEGSTKDNLDAANKAVGNSDAVNEELKKSPKLDAAAKATFGSGLVSLASGVSKYVVVGKNVSDISSGLSSAPLMQLPKLQSAVLIVSKFPSSMSSVASALKNAIAFAQSNDIPVPADATKALAAL
jgi:hypothetical protein